MSAGQHLAYRLRLPGPVAVPADVQQAIAAQVLNHRGSEFNQIMRTAAALAQPVFGTQNDIMFFAASGTGVMEASLINALGRGERALVIANGQFGERFASIAAAHGIIVDTLNVAWGENVDPQIVSEKLQHENFQAVVAVHNESSTGAVADIEALGRIVAQSDAIFIVDSVSGLGAVEMRQDDWGVDILVSASQKALMCPPGLGLVSVSAKGWTQIEKDEGKSRFYWDLRKARIAAAKGQTTFTTPVTLMAGLCRALSMIEEEGLENVLARHRLISDGLRAGGAALGLSLFTKASLISSAVTVFSMPAELDGNAVVTHMHTHFNTVIAGARNRLAGKVIRIGTMGSLTQADILTDLDYLEATFKALNWPVQSGQATHAARKIFEQSGTEK